jgi:hypothetical protein
MYTFYTDKPTNFECNISLQGAKLSKSKARLVLESNDINFIFYGTIDSNGKCMIPVSRLKNRLDEDTVGTAKLEVIAEDTYFEPWEDKFEIKTNRKVTVEVKNDTKKPMVESTDKKVKVTVKDNSKIKLISEEFIAVLKKYKIDGFNINKNKKVLGTISNVFLKRYKLNESQQQELISNVLTNLLK